MEISKEDALAICRKCPDYLKKGCEYYDVEGNLKGHITPPDCMLPLLSNLLPDNQRPPEGQKKSLGASSINENTPSFNENGRTKTVSSSADPSIHPSPSSIVAKVDGKPLNYRALKTLRLFSIGYHEREIARLTKEKRPTVQSIKNRLVKLKLLKPVGKSNVRSYPKFYYATPKGMKLLEYNEKDTRNQEPPPLTNHSSSYKYPHVEGILPTSKHPIKMNHWTGYDFHYSNHIIRTIPGKKRSWVVVFVNVDLSADTVDNLNHKYEELARSFARKFSEKYGLKLDFSQPQRYKKPHYTLKNSAVAKKLIEQGEFRIELNDGVEIFDGSRSHGDRETTDEEKARQWENAYLQTPKEIPKLRAEVYELKEEFHETKERLSKIEHHVEVIADRVSIEGQKFEHPPVQVKEKCNTLPEAPEVMYQ